MPDRIKSLGEIAYEAWASVLDSENREWQQLPRNEQQAWEYAARVVLRSKGMFL